MITLAISRLIGYVSVSRGVAFVERILGESIHLVEKQLCRFLGHAAPDGAFYFDLAVVVDLSVDEIVAVQSHDVHFLFAHRAPDLVRLSVGIPRKRTADLHDLFLIDHAAVCYAEYRFQHRVRVMHRFGVAFALDIVGNKLHGPGTIEGNSRYYVFKTVRFEVFHHPLHSPAFQLKHCVGVSRSNKLEHVGVVILAILEIEFLSRRFLDYFYRLVDIGESSQSQKVHFEQTELLHLLHVVLSGDVVAAALQGHVVAQILAAYNHACGVHSRLTRHIFQCDCQINHPFHGIILVNFHELRHALVFAVQTESVFERCVERNKLGYLVSLGVRHAQHAAHVLDGVFGFHPAERDNLSHAGLCVLFYDVVDNLSAPVHAKIYVEVRHADSFGI